MGFRPFCACLCCLLASIRSHLRYTQHCFLVLGPPNFVLSLQFTHLPQSSITLQPLHLPHLAIRSLTLEAGRGRRIGGAGGCLMGLGLVTVVGSGSEADESSRGAAAAGTTVSLSHSGKALSLGMSSGIIARGFPRATAG